MIKINENTIRSIVSETLANLLENRELEYRTKGALGKKTLEKNGGKPPVKANPSDEEDGSQWAETADEILAKYKDEPVFDDSKTINGTFQINKRNPSFIDKHGNEQPADAINDFHNDYAIVQKDNQYNYINGDGEIISDEWFDMCNDFENGFGLVTKNHKKNFINGDGEFLLSVWVDRAGDFMGDTAPVIYNGERHNVNKEGNIL